MGMLCSNNHPLFNYSRIRIRHLETTRDPHYFQAPFSSDFRPISLLPQLTGIWLPYLFCSTDSSKITHQHSTLVASKGQLFDEVFLAITKAYSRKNTKKLMDLSLWPNVVCRITPQALDGYSFMKILDHRIKSVRVLAYRDAQSFLWHRENFATVVFPECLRRLLKLKWSVYLVLKLRYRALTMRSWCYLIPSVTCCENMRRRSSQMKQLHSSPSEGWCDMREWVL